MRRPQVLRGGQARARRPGEAAQARTAAAIAARHIGRAFRQGLCNASRQALFGERRAIYARLISPGGELSLASFQIDLTKIHCVHLRYSILARHQIAAEPACRFLQPRRRIGRDGSLFVAPVLRRRNQPPPPSMPCTSNRRVSAPAFRSFAISRYWADSKNPRKTVAFEKDRSTILSLSQRPSMIQGSSSAANRLPPNCLSTPLKRAA